MSLLRMGKKTKQAPQEVLKGAVAFFGEGGVGLTIVQQTPTEVQFEGGGGHVHVTVSPDAGSDKTDIDITTRDWEYDVKRFLRELS